MARLELAKNFTCQGIQTHFIYTFMLKGFDLRVIASRLKKGRSAEVDGFRTVIPNWTSRADAEGPDPIDPYLALNDPRLEFNGEVPVKRIQLNSGLSLDCHLTRLVVVSESGTGAVDYSLTIANVELNKAEVIAISNLGHRRVGSGVDSLDREISSARLLKQDDGDEVFLFEQFCADVTSTRAFISRTLGQKAWPWIEVDLGLVGWEPNNDLARLLGSHFEVPYPVLILEVNKSIYTTAFLDEQHASKLLDLKQKDIQGFRNSSGQLRKQYHRDLVSILCRSHEPEYPDMGFANRFMETDNGALVNMCSVANGFLHLYARSCLAVFWDLGLTKDATTRDITRNPARYLAPALLETIKYLRMRWHAFAVSARWLDRVTVTICQDKISFREAMDALVEVRRGVALSLREAISYRLSSGSLLVTHNAGLAAFRIEELQKVVADKMITLDRLFINISEQRSIRATSRLIEKQLQVLDAEPDLGELPLNVE